VFVLSIEKKMNSLSKHIYNPDVIYVHNEECRLFQFDMKSAIFLSTRGQNIFALKSLTNYMIKTCNLQPSILIGDDHMENTYRYYESDDNDFDINFTPNWKPFIKKMHNAFHTNGWMPCRIIYDSESNSMYPQAIDLESGQLILITNNVTNTKKYYWVNNNVSSYEKIMQSKIQRRVNTTTIFVDKAVFFYMPFEPRQVNDTVIMFLKSPNNLNYTFINSQSTTYWSGLIVEYMKLNLMEYHELKYQSNKERINVISNSKLPTNEKDIGIIKDWYNEDIKKNENQTKFTDPETSDLFTPPWNKPINSLRNNNKFDKITQQEQIDENVPNSTMDFINQHVDTSSFIDARNEDDMVARIASIQPIFDTGESGTLRNTISEDKMFLNGLKKSSDNNMYKGLNRTPTGDVIGGVIQDVSQMRKSGYMPGFEKHISRFDELLAYAYGISTTMVGKSHDTNIVSTQDRRYEAGQHLESVASDMEGFLTMVYRIIYQSEIENFRTSVYNALIHIEVMRTMEHMMKENNKNQTDSDNDDNYDNDNIQDGLNTLYNMSDNTKNDNDKIRTTHKRKRINVGESDDETRKKYKFDESETDTSMKFKDYMTGNTFGLYNEMVGIIENKNGDKYKKNIKKSFELFFKFNIYEKKPINEIVELKQNNILPDDIITDMAMKTMNVTVSSIHKNK
jgi:hypothetical protein